MLGSNLTLFWYFPPFWSVYAHSNYFYVDGKSSCSMIFSWLTDALSPCGLVFLCLCLPHILTVFISFCHLGFSWLTTTRFLVSVSHACLLFRILTSLGTSWTFWNNVMNDWDLFNLYQCFNCFSSYVWCVWVMCC